MSKKVLFIIPEYLTDSTGGLEQQAKLIISHIPNSHVLCLSDNISYYNNTHTFTCDNLYSLGKLDAIILRKYIKNIISPDVIILMTNDILVHFFMYVVQGLDVPIVLSISTDPRLFLRRLNGDVSACSNLLKSVDSLRIQLPSYLRFYTNYISESNIFIIPNASSNNRSNFSKKEPTAFVTSFNKENKNKAINEVIEAFLSANISSELYIYGHLSNLDIRYYDNEKIKFLPYCHNKEEIYNGKYAYINASYYEGMSNAVLDAASFAIPIIARRGCFGSSFLSDEKHYQIFDEETSLSSCIRYTYNSYVNNKQIYPPKDLSKYDLTKIVSQWNLLITTIQKKTSITLQYKEYLETFIQTKVRSLEIG